jgi:glycosyltransferase involved in cell wall biosynthesis
MAQDLSNKGWKEKKKYYKNIKGVTPSRWLRDCANASSLMKGTEVVCIPNCIDTTLFKPKDVKEARAFHNLPEDKILILFLAVKISDERKGFVHLRDALLELKENPAIDNDKIELVIVGNSKEEDFKEIPYKAYNLGHIGNPNAIINAYNAADIFVIPSLEDNLPNTIMESLACGTPCVGFETGGIPEMIEHQKNGYIADFKNAKSFAEGIAWTLDESRLEQLSQNARQKALDDYAWAVVSKQYVNLYENLLKGE